MLHDCEVLSEEIERELAVAYVLDSLIHIIEYEMDGDPMTSSQMSSSKLYDNKRLIHDTYIVYQQQPQLPSISNADSLDDFEKIEAQIAAEQKSDSLEDFLAIEQQIAAEQLANPNDAPAEQKVENVVEIDSVPHVEQQPQETPPVPAERKTLHVVHEENSRDSRSTSVGARGLLMRLEEENESLTEQVQVLERMNERLTKQLKETNEKLKKLGDEQEEKLKDVLKVEAEFTEREKEIQQKASSTEAKLKEVMDLLVAKEKQIEDLTAKVSELEMSIQLKIANESEALIVLEENKQKAEKLEDDVITLKRKIKHYIEDFPKIDELEMVKNYLHPEMAKRADSVVRDALGKHGLRGDAATRYISTTFNQLYGEHWQTILFREDGHGCFVYHNNNCYVRFRLGTYTLVLFRY